MWAYRWDKQIFLWDFSFFLWLALVGQVAVPFTYLQRPEESTNMNTHTPTHTHLTKTQLIGQRHSHQLVWPRLESLALMYFWQPFLKPLPLILKSWLIHRKKSVYYRNILSKALKDVGQIQYLCSLSAKVPCLHISFVIKREWKPRGLKEKENIRCKLPFVL